LEIHTQKNKEVKKLKINEQSLKTELKSYEDKPYLCLFEYIWNSFDAGSKRVDIKFDLPIKGFGFIDNVKIIDNGKGWDFEKNLNTETFLASSKSELNTKNKTLPMGKFGRGRYVFIWIADKIEILSGYKKIILNHNINIEDEEINEQVKGTEIHFKNIYQNFSDSLIVEDKLIEELIIEFGWFLAQNDELEIHINDKKIDFSTNIKSKKTLKKQNFSESLIEQLDKDFEVKILLWTKKPSEYSKFYFLDFNENEIFKQNTGFNKKSDEFWHSIYIKSNLFNISDSIEDEDTTQLKLDFPEKKIRQIKKRVINEIKEELVKLRKPYLVEQSEFLLDELKQEKIIPELSEFGIFDEQSYDDLLKTIYTISPSLFTGKSSAEKKFICATFAGLLSTQDDILIKNILEQLQELTDQEKIDLLDILNRSSLSNVVKTIKEIDHRLDVLEKLKFLIDELEKETLEVKHLQKILDENFWIFGEQFRLFSSTEGALRNVIIKYAKEILEIEDPVLDTEPKGEVDLFLTKTEATSEKIQKNIIVEIKRASKNLKEDKEYKQIYEYRKKILEQTLCNGENQYWEFYLIGKNYDDDIAKLIDNVKNHGEKEKGLTFNVNDGRVKIYVRKWSDILEVEWGTKMKYLKEKLQIQAKSNKGKKSDDIVNEIINDKTNT
jgi:hypothetical protein